MSDQVAVFNRAGSGSSRPVELCEQPASAFVALRRHLEPLPRRGRAGSSAEDGTFAVRPEGAPRHQCPADTTGLCVAHGVVPQVNLPQATTSSVVELDDGPIDGVAPQHRHLHRRRSRAARPTRRGDLAT